MTVPDWDKFLQRFEFHLTDSKFMTGHIARADDGYYSAAVSNISKIETPLPGTYNVPIICEARSSAAVAFEKLIIEVKNASEKSNLKLRLVVNNTKENHLSIDSENQVLEKHYERVAVQPSV